MRELIKEVAEVIRDLQTLGLVEKKDVISKLKIDGETKKYVLEVCLSVPNEVAYFCLEEFKQKCNRDTITVVAISKTY